MIDKSFTIFKVEPSKRDGIVKLLFHLAFTWEKPALLPGLAALAESSGLTTYIFPAKPGIRYLRTSFHFHNLHINKQNWCKIKSYPKKCWPRQALSCVRSFDLLALLGGPALLSAFKFAALLGEVLDSR